MNATTKPDDITLPARGDLVEFQLKEEGATVRGRVQSTGAGGGEWFSVQGIRHSFSLSSLSRLTVLDLCAPAPVHTLRYHHCDDHIWLEVSVDGAPWRKVPGTHDPSMAQPVCATPDEGKVSTGSRGSGWMPITPSVDDELREAESKLHDWATGKNSYWNEVHGSVTGDYPGQFERAAAADAAEIQKLTNTVIALRLLKGKNDDFEVAYITRVLSAYRAARKGADQ